MNDTKQNHPNQPDTGSAIRGLIEKTARDKGESLSALSQLIGRNPAYMQQYLRRGSPRVLPERERRIIARYLAIDERMLGAIEPWRPICTSNDRATGKSNEVSG